MMSSDVLCFTEQIKVLQMYNNPISKTNQFKVKQAPSFTGDTMVNRSGLHRARLRPGEHSWTPDWA